MGGTVSRVEELLRLGLDPGRAEETLTSLVEGDEREWETKTVTSAVKSYFRYYVLLQEKKITRFLHMY